MMCAPNLNVHGPSMENAVRRWFDPSGQRCRLGEQDCGQAAFDEPEVRSLPGRPIGQAYPAARPMPSNKVLGKLPPEILEVGRGDSR